MRTSGSIRNPMIKAHGHFEIRKIMPMMLIGSLLAWSTRQTHAAQDAGSSSTWNMTYHAGAAPIRSGK